MKTLSEIRNELEKIPEHVFEFDKKSFLIGFDTGVAEMKKRSDILWNGLFDHIKHGDKVHQKWLKDEIEAYHKSVDVEEIVGKK